MLLHRNQSGSSDMDQDGASYGSDFSSESGSEMETGLEAVLVPLVFGLIFVVGVLGNGLVLLVVGRQRLSKGSAGTGARSGIRGSSVTNLWLSNLASADLSFLFFCVPFQASVYSLPYWTFGSFLCSFSHFFSCVSMTVSIFTLVAMALDRYLAVVRGAGSRATRLRTRRNALAGVCVIWTLAVLLSVPVARHQVLTGHWSAPNRSFCWEIWNEPAQRRAYKLSVLLLGFVVPLTLICCSYVKILFHLHKKMKNMSKKSEKSKRKTAQTVLMVVAAFALCWLPHHVIAMWAEFGQFPLNDATFVFRIIAHCFSYGHSCVNPVLYAFLSDNFRKACRQVFSCHFLFPASQSPPLDTSVQFRMENFSTTHSATTM